MKDIFLIFLIFALVCLTTVIASDKYIGFDNLGNFPIEVSNCELIECFMMIEGEEVFSIKVDTSDYDELIKLAGKVYNSDLIEIR